MALPTSIEINGVTYAVSLESEKDELGNVAEFVLLQNGEQQHRLSPSTTAEELAMYADSSEREHQL